MINKITFLILISLSVASAQKGDYNSNEQHPYGRINPDAPVQLSDYSEMIGSCECQSVRRNPDGSWQDTVAMTWNFKYILNGFAVQDETWKSDGVYATSIRQFNTDSLNWVVSYYSSIFVSNSVNVWTGNREQNKIVLKMSQKSPQGYDGFSRLTFYDISDTGYKWIGEWTDPSGNIVYPFWKIVCRKVE